MRAPGKGDRGCCNREPDSARADHAVQPANVIALWLPDPEQRDSRCVDRQAQKSKAEIPMRQKMYLSALVAASLIGASCSALAQNTGAAAGAISPNQAKVLWAEQSEDLSAYVRRAYRTSEQQIDFICHPH